MRVLSLWRRKEAAEGLTSQWAPLPDLMWPSMRRRVATNYNRATMIGSLTATTTTTGSMAPRGRTCRDLLRKVWARYGLVVTRITTGWTFMGLPGRRSISTGPRLGLASGLQDFTQIRRATYYISLRSIPGQANAKVPASKYQRGNHLPAAFPPLALLPVQNLSGSAMTQKVQKSRCPAESVARTVI